MNQILYSPGPFTVIRRNQGGAYILNGADGTEYIRPPGVLKLVHQDLVIPGLPGIVAHVDKILEHREIDGEKEYLVRWKNLSADLNEWVKHSDFNDLDPFYSITKIFKMVATFMMLYRREKKNIM